MLPVGSLEGLDAATRLLAAHRAARPCAGDRRFRRRWGHQHRLGRQGAARPCISHTSIPGAQSIRFGYGLTPEIVALAAGRAPSLIVTVITACPSVAGVDAARDIGVPVLVTDHHLPGLSCPRAEVIVNPNFPGSQFASPPWPASVVAFLPGRGLAKALGRRDFELRDLLDLVALGTVADMVPLDRNNRILVSQGIKRIRAGAASPAIRALLESAGRRQDA